MCGVYWSIYRGGHGVYIPHYTLLYIPVYTHLLCCNCNAIQNIQFKTASKPYNKNLHSHGIFYHQPILTRLKTPHRMLLNKPCFLYPCKYIMLIQTRLEQPVNSLRINVFIWLCKVMMPQVYTKKIDLAVYYKKIYFFLFYQSFIR